LKQTSKDFSRKQKMSSGVEQSQTQSSKQLDNIFELLKEKKTTDVIQYIKEGNLTEIDCVDEHGTTPLQYAAFRGFLDVCELLINRGADVNAKTHDQGYSALMFASISNHKDVVSLLLQNEADADYTNTIGRTATQMASFVNSNECVDLINSYISKKSLEYFTEIHSINETEPKLPKGECLDSLHKLLISSSNYSPVRILKSIKTLNKNNVLIANIGRIMRTLDAFVEKAFKNEEGECPNDLLAYKLHYYRYIFEFLNNTRSSLIKKQEASQKTGDENELNEKAFEFCFKQLLVEEDLNANSSNNETSTPKFCRVFQEKFLRESIRQFPYKECALIRQMVTILARAQIGTHPSALYVITSCLNGQRFNENLDSESESSKKAILECATCTNKSSDAKWCTHCKKVAYCDQFCQKLDWPLHKKHFKNLSQA
jgi:hypothetical protein